MRGANALLWVVLLANLVAMLFQVMSAKLGIVTGKNLAQLCRARFPKPIVLLMWGVSEIAAMATDLAEFLGGAIGLTLLFHLPLLAGMAIIALVTYGLLLFESAGFRPLELAIGALVGVIGLSYLAELFIAPVVWPQVLLHTFSPRLPDRDALTISVGIVGATVMPHTLFLHSGLTQDRVVPRTAGRGRKSGGGRTSTIARAGHNTHGNLAQAARALGVSRSTLYRKIEIYQLEGIVKPASGE